VDKLNSTAFETFEEKSARVPAHPQTAFENSIIILARYKRNEVVMAKSAVALVFCGKLERSKSTTENSRPATSAKRCRVARNEKTGSSFGNPRLVSQAVTALRTAVVTSIGTLTQSVTLAYKGI
jgi:hypothetical protein